MWLGSWLKVEAGWGAEVGSEAKAGWYAEVVLEEAVWYTLK